MIHPSKSPYKRYDSPSSLQKTHNMFEDEELQEYTPSHTSSPYQGGQHSTSPTSHSFAKRFLQCENDQIPSPILPSYKGITSCNKNIFALNNNTTQQCRTLPQSFSKKNFSLDVVAPTTPTHQQEFDGVTDSNFTIVSDLSCSMQEDTSSVSNSNQSSPSLSSKNTPPWASTIGTNSNEELSKRKNHNCPIIENNPSPSSSWSSIGQSNFVFSNSNRSHLVENPQQEEYDKSISNPSTRKKQSLQSSLSVLRKETSGWQLQIDDCERDCNHKTSAIRNIQKDIPLLNTPPESIFTVSSPSREALFHQFKHFDSERKLIDNIKSLLNSPPPSSDNLMKTTEGETIETNSNDHSHLENLCSRYRRIIEDVCTLSLNTNQINEIIQTKYCECLNATNNPNDSSPTSTTNNNSSNNGSENVEENESQETDKPSNVIIHVKREATLIDNYPKEKKKKTSSNDLQTDVHLVKEDSFLGGSDLTPLSLQFFTFPNDIIAQLIACKKSNQNLQIEEELDDSTSPLEFELQCIDARKHELLKDIFSGEEQLETLENNSHDQEEDQEEDYENFIEQSKLHPPARSYHTFINTDAYGFKYYGFCYTKFFTYRVCNVTRNGKPLHSDNIEFFFRFPSCICILSRYAFHSTFLKFYSFLDQYLFENNDGFYCSDCEYFTFNEELLKYMYDFFNNTDPNATPATPGGDINLTLPALYDKLVIHFPSMAIKSPSDYVFSSKMPTNPSSNCINEVKVEFDKMLFVGTKEEHFKEAGPVDRPQPISQNASPGASTGDLFNSDENVTKSGNLTDKVPYFPMCDFDYSILTTCLSIDNIITIVNYLSLEKSLIFHSVNLYRMVMIMESLRHLIYPFRMTSIYIPIAHEKIINFLEAPFPYMVGTHSEVMWNHFRIGFEKKSSPFRRTLCSQFEVPSSTQKMNVLNLNETKFSNKDNMDYEMINIPEGVCIVNLDEDVIRFVGEENDSNCKSQWKWSSALVQYIKDAVEKSRSTLEKSNSEYMNQIIKKRDAQIPSLTRRGSSFFFKGRKKGASTFFKNTPTVKSILESSEEVEVTGKDPLSSGLFAAATDDHSVLSPLLTRKRSAAVRPSASLIQKEPTSLSTQRLSPSIISNKKKSVIAIAQDNQVSPLLKVHPIREIFLSVFIRLLTCYEIFIQFDKFDPKNDMNMTDIFNIDKFLSLDNYGGFSGASQGSQPSSCSPFQSKDKTMNKRLLMALTHYGNYGGHVDSVFLREFFKTQIFHYFIQKKCELFWNISNSIMGNSELNTSTRRTDFAQSLPDLFVQHDNMLEQNKQLSEHVLASTVTNTFYKLFDYKMQQSAERFSLNLSLMQSSYRRSFLYKRGRFRKSWKKRFFVLRDDNTMLYYEGSDETQQKGSVKLTTDGLTKIFSVKVNEKRIFEKNSESEEDSYFTWSKSQQLELATLLKFARAMNQSEDSGSINHEEEGVPSISEQFPTPYVFVVFVPGGRLLYCCAESEKAREEWIRVLRAKVMQSGVTSSLQDYLNRLKWQQSKKNFNKKILINSVGHILNHQPSTSSISHIQSTPNLNSPVSPVTSIHQQPLVLHKIFDFIPTAFRNSSERYKERTNDLGICISTRMPLEEFTLRSCLEVIN